VIYLPRRQAGTARTGWRVMLLLLGFPTLLGLMSASVTGVAPLPTAPTQKPLLPTATPTEPKPKRPGFGSDELAPPNAGVLSLNYKSACNFSDCSFTPQTGYTPEAICTFDPGDGGPSTQFQCLSTVEYSHLVSGTYYAHITGAGGDQQSPTTRTPTNDATSSSAASTPSSNGAYWPPATTNWPSCIAQRPSCTPSSSGAPC
jgi:hypothetical protein